MATAKPSAVKLPGLDIRIAATIMACREHIMRYFKGTCVETFTAGGCVERHSLPTGRPPYQYMREDLRNENPQVLSIGGVQIAALHSIPDSLTLYSQPLELTPGLKRVNKELRRFMQQYLGGIEVITNDTLSLDNNALLVLPADVKDERLFTTLPRDVDERDPYARMQQFVEITMGQLRQVQRAEAYIFDTPTGATSLWGEHGANTILSEDTPF